MPAGEQVNLSSIHTFEGDFMKKLFTLVCALAIGSVMAVAQAGGSSSSASTSTAPAKKHAHHKAAKHKAAKKSKKNAGSTSTTPK